MKLSPDLRALTPASARLCLNVERFWLRELRMPRGLRLLLALSGGADSTALALILRILSPRLKLELCALTVNHGLRPEAGEDARWTLHFCEQLDIACVLREADVAALAAQKHLSLEEAGRTLRYDLLETARQEQDADFVVTGHHNGDLAEDILLRLTRGTGWPALGGMAARDEGRQLLRPLLFTQPEALKNLLRECRIHWREDASNRDCAFARNRMRHAVLPHLREKNPALNRTLADLWRLAQWDKEYWQATLDAALAAQPWQEDSAGIVLPRTLLAALHPAARLRLYLEAVRRLSSGAAGRQSRSGGQARARTLLALDEALRERRGNTRFQLPGGLEARLKSGEIRFFKHDKGKKTAAK